MSPLRLLNKPRTKKAESSPEPCTTPCNEGLTEAQHEILHALERDFSKADDMASNLAYGIFKRRGHVYFVILPENSGLEAMFEARAKYPSGLIMGKEPMDIEEIRTVLQILCARLGMRANGLKTECYQGYSMDSIIYFEYHIDMEAA